MLALPSCQTQRTVKSAERGSYAFDPEDKAWAGGEGKKGTTTMKEEEEGKKKMTKKFLNAGFKTDEETGAITVANNNLFAGEKSRYGNKSFGGRKEAKLRGREAEKKLFQTPEYLKRDTFEGGKERARETGLFVKEDSSGSNKFGTVNKQEAGLLQRVNPFAQKTFNGSNKTFATSSNREGTRARAEAPTANGIQRTAGFMDNTKMSVDDVKKMLNPGAYANARGL